MLTVSKAYVRCWNETIRNIFKFVVTIKVQWSNKKINVGVVVKDYYSKCFVHIITAAIPRRAEGTAQSFGLMGIKTLSKWPCLVPSYDIMPWWDSDELFKRIDIERKKIGTVQTELAQKCYDFFDFSDDWLYVDYWKE